jgi:hypothetical protein
VHARARPDLRHTKLYVEANMHIIFLSLPSRFELDGRIANVVGKKPKCLRVTDDNPPVTLC